MTGYPKVLATLMALSSLVTMSPGGCLMSSLVRILYHLSLSSASSMLSGEVPQILTFPSPGCTDHDPESHAAADLASVHALGPSARNRQSKSQMCACLLNHDTADGMAVQADQTWSHAGYSCRTILAAEDLDAELALLAFT